MQTKNFRPKTIHKRFHDNIFNLGCVVTQQWPQLHHVVGASFTDNGVWIGQWWILPLSPDLHKDGKVNVDSAKMEFYRKVGSEKKLYWWMLDNYLHTYRDMPVPPRVIGTIYLCSHGVMETYEDEVNREDEAFIELMESARLLGWGEWANETEEYIKQRTTSSYIGASL